MTTPCGRGLTHLLVVVPARDEAGRLDACLGALERAVDHLAASGEHGGVDVDLLLVLDRCRDTSAQVAAAHPGVRVMASLSGSAGGARRLGVAAGLARSAAAGAARERTWVANTDADSTVPPDWLAVHARAAADGADLLLGTVVPDAREVRPDVALAWSAAYRAGGAGGAGAGHRHVHGANLGIRASTYLAVGGFNAVAAHEDVQLARAAELAGAVVVATAQAAVTTSARLRGRAPEGFASYLAALTSDGTDVAG